MWERKKNQANESVVGPDANAPRTTGLHGKENEKNQANGLVLGPHANAPRIDGSLCLVAQSGSAC
jgi:hypothetical protein